MSSEQDELLRLAIENERLRAQLKANEEAAAALREDRKERIERQILNISPISGISADMAASARRDNGELRVEVVLRQSGFLQASPAFVRVSKADIPVVSDFFARVKAILEGPK